MKGETIPALRDTQRAPGNMWARTGNAMAEEGRGPGRHPHTCLRVLGS